MARAGEKFGVLHFEKRRCSRIQEEDEDASRQNVGWYVSALWIVISLNKYKLIVFF